MKDSEHLHQELSNRIIGASMAVINELKPRLDEKLYENALVEELHHIGSSTDRQKQFRVYYRAKEIGLLIPDMIVDEKIIVDTKVVTALNDSHLAQMIGYLNITGLQVGYLINFKFHKLPWKRVIRNAPLEMSP